MPNLEAQLAVEFPEVERVRDDAGLAAWSVNWPPIYRATMPKWTFLWTRGARLSSTKSGRRCARFPYGQLRTYAQLAQAIDQPAAVRAAARACATNPVAVVTPCHRVVRSDGGLGGYRWGLERKKQLLESEKE